MRYTLLKLVQSVLTSMDSDEVDSITDNTEAEDIATMAEDCYYDLINREEWPFISRLVSVSSVSDTNNPTALILEDNVRSIGKLRYDCAKDGSSDKDYRLIGYVQPEDFIESVIHRKSSDTNVQVVSPQNEDTPEIMILNNHSPSFYTSFDDEFILFDSFDSSVESTVQSNKTICYGEVIPTFEIDDEYVIDVPSHVMPLYLAEVRAACHLYFKQQASPFDQKNILRNTSRLRRTKNRTGVDQYDQRSRKDFGRNSRPAGEARKLGRR